MDNIIADPKVNLYRLERNKINQQFVLGSECQSPTRPSGDKKFEDWKWSLKRILLVTDSVQNIYLTNEALEGFGVFKTRRQIICTAKYADDFVVEK
jgi:hypothetical protein